MAGAAMVAVLQSGCAVDNPTYRPLPDGEPPAVAADGGAAAAPTPDAGAHMADAAPKQLCTPGEFLGCAGPVKLKRCAEDGLGHELVTCPKGCNRNAGRCNDCDPKSKPGCKGVFQVSCNARGLVVKVACPYGCFAGKCKGCSLKSYFADKDGDGFGDAKSPQQACAKPDDFVLNDLDCHDGSPAAHPKQTAFFKKPMSGTKSYDYNCNKTEERERTGISLASCTKANGACKGSGWMLLVPKCGGAGLYVSCTKANGAKTCTPLIGMATQSCR